MVWGQCCSCGSSFQLSYKIHQLSWCPCCAKTSLGWAAWRMLSMSYEGWDAGGSVHFYQLGAFQQCFNKEIKSLRMWHPCQSIRMLKMDENTPWKPAFKKSFSIPWFHKGFQCLQHHSHLESTGFLLQRFPEEHAAATASHAKVLLVPVYPQKGKEISNN